MAAQYHHHSQHQTICCELTKQKIDEGHVYCSRDIINPVAMAHMIQHIAGKEVGCNAEHWNKFYPTVDLLQKFFNKCRAHKIRIHFLNYDKHQRADLKPIINANRDIIAYMECGF